MNPIELSLCFNSGQDTNRLVVLLKASDDPAIADLPLAISPMLWDGYKSTITSMALYGRGVDISQVGFPLTTDLIGMNALRLISPRMMAEIGGEAAFHPTIWKIAKRHQEGAHWSLPWLADPRAIFYWKDLLDEAGVSASTAFQSAESLQAACQQMQAHGMEAPWVLGMADGFAIVHAIVSWVWGKGGDFISSDGARAAFFEKNTLDGLEAFFRLMPYMPQAGLPIGVADAQRWFVERKSAITIGPYGFLREFQAAAPPAFRDQLGVSMPPGPPLIAGSDLVLWAHSRNTDEMLSLLYSLFNPEIQLGYAEYLGDLPVTRAALEHLARSTDENIRAFVDILEHGRLFSVSKFSGMLEAQLAGVLADVWKDLAEHPTDDIRSQLQIALEPVRRRFDMLNGA